MLYTECVSVALGIQNVIRLRRIVISGLSVSLYIFSTVSHFGFDLKKTD
jgi:hypothetical protein